MHSVTGVILIILIACLMPYIFTLIAKKVGGFRAQDNANPRVFLAKTEGLAARANAVQQNSFEGLPLFIAAMLMAEYLVIPDRFILPLGGAYLVLRVLYGICYLADWSRLRSVIWLLATACPVLLLSVCIKLYS
ncbi:MAG: hypothetical protein E6Q25_09640 [Acinetobacter sp.]|jgi:uncharacterized MAPEG superfamily protein|nr:MAG: hypothetical protein E6Q25_09640 [Acinetobacter sp.]